MTDLVQWQKKHSLCAKRAAVILVCTVSSINAKRIGARPLTDRDRAFMAQYDETKGATNEP